MSKNFSRGSSEQMIAAFERRIDELQDTSSVTSATQPTKNKSFSRGTSDQMLAAFENRIAELQGDVTDDINSSDAITAAYRDDVIEDDVLGASTDRYIEVENDPTYTSRYLDTLIGHVDNELTESNHFDSWTWEHDAQEGKLVLITIIGDNVSEYSIPLDDLSNSYDGIDQDVQYILSAVLQGGGAADEGMAEEVVEESTDLQTVQASLFEFGAEAANQYGDLICEHLAGKTVSKRRDLAEQPGGLIYEANQLGIDMWDLLEALEGLCRQRRCREIDDSTYEVLACDFADGIQDEDVPVEGSFVYDESDTSVDQWTELESKLVADADGMMTDYTLYSNSDGTLFICMFGDKDIYTPDSSYADFETEDEQGAYEWFHSYRGFEDELEI